jgi:predicted Zn finger-like uncharacterized protein
MIIDCISCSKKFKIKDELFPLEGSKVRCGACSEVWFYHPTKNFNETEIPNINLNITEEENEKPLVLSEKMEENHKTEEHQEENIQNDDNQKNDIKIFGTEEYDLPDRSEMDRNLSTYQLDREKNEKIKLKENKNRLTRLLFYLLIVLILFFTIILVPYREQFEMAFPSLRLYFDIIAPLHQKIFSYFL